MKERAPDLATLKLEVEESADTAVYSKHTRIIVIDRAPKTVQKALRAACFEDFR